MVEAKVKIRPMQIFLFDDDHHRLRMVAAASNRSKTAFVVDLVLRAIRSTPEQAIVFDATQAGGRG
jgi:hypothetical protein